MALQITQIKSSSGRQANQRRTLESLGLHRMHQTVVVPDRPEIRGMAVAVTHLVRVEQVSDDLLPRGGRSKYRDHGQGPITSQGITLADADTVDESGEVTEDAGGSSTGTAGADAADEEEQS